MDPEGTAAAQVILFAASGGEETRTEIEVGPNGVTRVNLNSLIRADARTEKFGSMMLEFTRGSASTTMGNVVVDNDRTGVIFDLPLLGGYRYDDNNTLYASWWLPDDGTDATVTLFNLSDQPIVISPSIAVERNQIAIPALTVASHETRKLSLRALLKSFSLEGSDKGFIDLRYTGPAHALDPALLIANSQTGFSLVSDFNAKHEQPAPRQATWQFANVFLGADPRLGFSAKERLRTLALFSNGTSSTLNLRLTAYLTDEQGKAITEHFLRVEPMGPFETRLVNLSQLVGLPSSKLLSSIALKLTHDGVPGDLAATIFTVGKTGDFVLRAQGTVHPAKVVDSSYWDISGDRVAILTLHNPSSVAVAARATLFFRDKLGQTRNYGLPEIVLPANSVKVLNLKKTILSGTPDSKDNIIPPDTTFGTLAIEVMDKTGPGVIFGGSSTFDPVRGGYGLGAFPPNCDLCSTCEDCIQPTDTGGDCVPSCSDPSCCPEPPPPVPTYFYATGATPLLSTTACSFGQVGSGFDVHYQVLDQYGDPMQVAGMTPLEQVTQNGRIVVPFNQFATPFSTTPSGTFDDTPVVQCVQLPIGGVLVGNPCSSWTQAFEIQYGGLNPIITTTSVRGCAKGITIQIFGNPVGTEVFSIGTVN